MLRRFWLLSCALIVVTLPNIALARNEAEGSQIRYIEELKQRNADYGPGCNGIGVSVPQTVNMPTDITTRWVAGHSACIPGMRLVMTCIGEVTGEERIIGCMLRVADGEAAGSIACDRFTLIAPSTRFTPDSALSETLSQGSESASQPCSEPSTFAPGLTVAAAFLVPAAESMGDLAVLIDVNGSEVPAFLIPAGQLGLPEATSGS